MPLTTAKDVVASLRIGIAKVPAEPMLTALKAAKRLYAGNDAQDVADKAQELKDVLVYIKQTTTVIAASGAEKFNRQMTLLRAAWGTLIEDDPVTTNIDRKKMRTRVRAALTEALTLPAGSEWLAERLEYMKRVVIGDYQTTDPVAALFLAARATIEAATDPIAVDAAIATINKNAHLLAPAP